MTTPTSNTCRVQTLHTSWKAVLAWVDIYLGGLSDENLQQTLRPGGNHGVWLLGHLIASDDDLSVYLDKGPMLYPEYQTTFRQSSAIMPPEAYPEVPVLRKHWKQVCDKNEAVYAELNDDELDQAHALLQEPVERDPFKTRLGCLVNWMLHQQYHVGQLGLLYAICNGKAKI